MPFITNYQRNESENDKEVSSPHTSQNDHLLKAHKQMLERLWKKRNPVTLLMGMHTGTATLENSVKIP